MAAPTSRAFAASPVSPTACMLSNTGTSKPGVFAMRDTLPPSSSTPMKRPVLAARCMAMTKSDNCSGEAMFLPKSTTPDAGYSASIAAMSSSHAVAAGPFASCTSSGESLRTATRAG